MAPVVAHCILRRSYVTHCGVDPVGSVEAGLIWPGEWDTDAAGFGSVGKNQKTRMRSIVGYVNHFRLALRLPALPRRR